MDKRFSVSLLFLLLTVSFLYVFLVGADTTSLYVTGFDSTYDLWSKSGTSPWLGDNTDYIYTKTASVQQGYFSFADLTEGATINSVTLYMECKADDAPNDDGFYVWVWDGSSWTEGGLIQPSSSAYGWETLSLTSKLGTDVKVNAAEVYFVMYKVGGADEVYIQRCYLYVDYDPANAVPVIDSMRITETTDEIPITTLDVWVWYDFEVQITDLDQLSDLDTVTIRFMENPSVAIDVDTPDFVEDSEYWYRYTEATNTWEWHSGSVWTSTSDYLDPANCEYPVKTGTQGWVLFRVRFSEICKKSSLWEFAGYVIDDSSDSDVDSITGVTVNMYLELTVNTLTHGWSSTLPGDSDVLIDEGDISLTVTSNVVFDVQAKGNGDLSSGSDTVPLGNVVVHETTLGSATSLTTGYQDIGGLTGEVSGKSLGKSFKAWIDVPTGKESGDYGYTLSIQIVEGV